MRIRRFEENRVRLNCRRGLCPRCFHVKNARQCSADKCAVIDRAYSWDHPEFHDVRISALLSTRLCTREKAKASAFPAAENRGNRAGGHPPCVEYIADQAKK